MTFENIFSKKRVKTKEKVKIIVDDREKNSSVSSILIREGFELDFQRLEVGDYLVRDLIIERKTLADLQSSVINKRLLRQLQSLKKYEKRALIIENHEEDLRIISENAFRGLVLSILYEHQTPVIFTKDAEDSALYIKVLALKKGKGKSSLKHSRILPTDKDQLKFILEGFPGIGPVTAEKILTRVNTLREVFSLSKEQFIEMLGKKGERVHYYLNLEYSSLGS